VVAVGGRENDDQRALGEVGGRGSHDLGVDVRLRPAQGNDGTDDSDQRAYLAKTFIRQALNSLRTTQRRREEYIGPWLPEPVVTLPEV
jgi:hypothetical protein